MVIGYQTVLAHVEFWLDHFALNAASEEAFWEMQRRVIAEGRDIARVMDMGLLLSFNFTDPRMIPSRKWSGGNQTDQRQGFEKRIERL